MRNRGREIDRAEASSKLALLSPKLIEALELMIPRGATYKLVANQLGISERAVQDRIARAKRVLGFNGTAYDLIDYYLELKEACGQTTRVLTPDASHEAIDEDISRERADQTPLFLGDLITRLTPGWRLALIPAAALALALLAMIVTNVAVTIGDL